MPSGPTSGETQPSTRPFSTDEVQWNVEADSAVECAFEYRHDRDGIPAHGQVALALDFQCPECKAQSPIPLLVCGPCMARICRVEAFIGCPRCKARIAPASSMIRSATPLVDEDTPL